MNIVLSTSYYDGKMVELPRFKQNLRGPFDLFDTFVAITVVKSQ